MTGGHPEYQRRHQHTAKANCSGKNGCCETGEGLEFRNQIVTIICGHGCLHIVTFFAWVQLLTDECKIARLERDACPKQKLQQATVAIKLGTKEDLIPVRHQSQAIFRNISALCASTCATNIKVTSKKSGPPSLLPGSKTCQTHARHRRTEAASETSPPQFWSLKGWIPR